MTNERPFRKMHGAGNDFIIIDDMSLTFEATPWIIKALCDRHRGIGADGCILIQPSRVGEFGMRYYNSDGSEAQMCGNGARCAARFAHDIGLAGAGMRFETGAGLIAAEIEGGAVKISIGAVTDLRLDVPVPGASAPVHFALCGVPHAVMFAAAVREMNRESFLALARAIRHFSGFGPQGTNVDLAQVLAHGALIYRTYERGVEDETLACGTGAVAVSVVAAHLGLVAPPVRCETSGGDVLSVEFEKNSTGAENCRLSGPAVFSFSGVFDPDDFGPSASSQPA